jgi:uncharacterized membrane protein YtjA (UPF0391 family)
LPDGASLGTPVVKKGAVFRNFMLGTKSASSELNVQFSKTNQEEFLMFNWALTFLIIAIVAGVFGFSGIAGTATNIAWILFVVGLVLAVVFALTGRRPRV